MARYVEDKKRFHVGAAIGYFLLSLSPLFLFFAVQIIAAFLVMMSFTAMFIIGVLVKFQDIPFDSEVLMEQLMTVFQDNIMATSLIYQVIALAIFGVWYYLAWGQKKDNTVKKLTAKSIGKIIALGVFFELLTSSILAIVEMYFPSIIEAYEQLMEEAGLNEISIPVALAAIIMAPIVEELAFRGVTMRLALHITGKNDFRDNATFWIANVLQALAFGIGHLNLVQGCYAFALGIVMGCVIRKYKTIYASMILHAVFNFSGTILAAILSFVPYADTLLGNLIIIMLSGMACFAVFLTIRKDE